MTDVVFDITDCDDANKHKQFIVILVFSRTASTLAATVAAAGAAAGAAAATAAAKIKTKCLL
jgi:hypothetical protein